jgi:hypothetical protein
LAAEGSIGTHLPGDTSHIICGLMLNGRVSTFVFPGQDAPT